MMMVTGESLTCPTIGIEDLPNQIPDSIVGPFSKAAVSKHAGGFLTGGTAWYRNNFVLTKHQQVKKSLSSLMECI